DATEEALALLLVGDVEEELADDDAVVGEVALEGADVLVALVPDVLGDQLGGEPLPLQEFRVHPDHQRLLVVAAVEDTDAAALGEALHAAPEEVVVEVFRG